MTASIAQCRALILTLISVFLVIWGALGLFQGLQRGFTGGLYDIHYIVPGVVPGGAADRAGFRAGDRVVSVDGTPVEKLGMESRWPRSFSSRIGETRVFLVERNGQRVPISYTYTAPPRGAVNNRIAAAITGLGFLCIGLWTIVMVKTPPATVLGYMGLTAGVAMSLGLGPSLGRWNGVTGHISTAATVLVFILLLRFFELFPKPKRISEMRSTKIGILVPWLGLLVFLFVELIVHPALYYSTGSVAFPLMLVYAILAFAALVHTVAKSTRASLADSGMALILVGLLIALAGIVAQYTWLLKLPSWAYSFPLIVLPLSMAIAARRQARSGGAVTVG